MLKRRPYIALLLLPAVYDLVYPSATGHLVFCVATLLLGLVYAKVPVRWSREEPMFPDMTGGAVDAGRAHGDPDGGVLADTRHP